MYNLGTSEFQYLEDRLIEHDIDLQTASSSVSPSGSVTFDGSGGAKLTTGSPVWIAAQVDVDENPINILEFDFEFLSDAAATLSVTFDENLVFVKDALAALDELTGSGLLWLGEDVTNGSHELRFTLESQTVTADAASALIQNIRIGYYSISAKVGTLTLSGDYNGNGAVEQGDLDLVLLNWGTIAAEPPSGWINDVPSGQVGQAQLDGVLLHWGDVVPFEAAIAANPAAPVPEPAGCVMLAAVAALACTAAQKRKATPGRRTPHAAC
jgi:hypothetical protein